MLTTLMSPEGRAPRLHYFVTVWLIYAFVLVVAVLADHNSGIPQSVVIGLILIVGAPLIVLALMTQVRRFHDRGKSGWMSLLFLVAPLLALPVVMLQGLLPALLTQALAALPMIAINGWLGIELGCLRGEPQENHYGPPVPTRIDEGWCVLSACFAFVGISRAARALWTRKVFLLGAELSGLAGAGAGLLIGLYLLTYAIAVWRKSPNAVVLAVAWAAFSLASAVGFHYTATATPPIVFTLLTTAFPILAACIVVWRRDALSSGPSYVSREVLPPSLSPAA